MTTGHAEFFGRWSRFTTAMRETTTVTILQWVLGVAFTIIIALLGLGYQTIRLQLESGNARDQRLEDAVEQLRARVLHLEGVDALSIADRDRIHQELTVLRDRQDAVIAELAKEHPASASQLLRVK